MILHAHCTSSYLTGKARDGRTELLRSDCAVELGRPKRVVSQLVTIYSQLDWGPFKLATYSSRIVSWHRPQRHIFCETRPGKQLYA